MRLILKRCLHTSSLHLTCATCLDSVEKCVSVMKLYLHGRKTTTSTTATCELREHSLGTQKTPLSIYRITCIILLSFSLTYFNWECGGSDQVDVWIYRSLWVLALAYSRLCCNWSSCFPTVCHCSINRLLESFVWRAEVESVWFFLLLTKWYLPQSFWLNLY